MRILLVEDDKLLGDGVQAGLSQAGCSVDWVMDGVAAELALKTGEYAAVVLDLGLPRLTGLELLRRLRAAGNKVPVLILTARDTVEDRIKGLDCGADDIWSSRSTCMSWRRGCRALVRRSRASRTEAVRWRGRSRSCRALRDVSRRACRAFKPRVRAAA